MLKKLAIILVALFLCCSCSKKNLQEEITFSSWGSVTETAIINKLIKEYEKENPNIKINFIHVPQNYFQKIHLLFASSQAPDVIFINNLYLPVYAGKLEPLDNIINKEEFHNKSISALSYQGHLYAIPRDLSCFMFFYNKDITGSINSDWTINDFKKAVRKYTDKNHWGVSYERDIFKAEPYILTMGEKEGLEFYKSLEGVYAPNPSDVGSSTLAQMFLDGKIAFYLSGRWLYPKINESASFSIGFVTFPGTVYADSSGWAISKSSKHKNEAIKFVQFLSSEKSEEYFTETGLIVPARKNLLQKIKEKAFVDAITNSVTRNAGKDYNKKRDFYNKKFFN